VDKMHISKDTSGIRSWTQYSQRHEIDFCSVFSIRIQV